MADGLLRPSEALPEGKYKTGEHKGERKCNIYRDDVQFTREVGGRVVEAVVYIQPIKQHGKKVDNTDKVPIIIAAGREGTLRTHNHVTVRVRPPIDRNIRAQPGSVVLRCVQPQNGR